jgi:hypothetical protein
MTYLDWMPAFVMSGAVTLGGGLAGLALKLSIEKGVQSLFDIKLEKIKADFRRDEEQLRADLRSRDAQIDSLRKGALSTMASRHAALDKRRLEAVENIWAAVVQRSQLKLLVGIAKSINMDVMMERASKRGRDAENLQSMARLFCETGKVDEIGSLSNAYSERPFVTPVIWALFSAYNLVILRPAAQFMLMRGGVDGGVLNTSPAMTEMIKKALPHQAEFIDKFGPNSVILLVDELEEKLLTAICQALEGKELDGQSVQQANEILKLADEVLAGQSAKVDVPEAIRAPS